MTLVNAETGELADQCTPDEARHITDQIKGAVEVTWSLIADAYTRGAHMALGYLSWDDYTLREFGTSRLRLPREERQEVVGSLRDAGLSVRAIAAVTGDSVGTVAAAARAGVQNRTPANPSVDRVEVTPNFKGSTPKVKGKDGKSYPATPVPKKDQLAEAVERYPWLDCPAPATQIIATAADLDKYVGAERESRIETSKKWAAAEVRGAEQAEAEREERRLKIDQHAMVDAALEGLVKWIVTAGRASNVLKDDPSLVDPDDAEWLDAIQAARRCLDDLTPIPMKLRRVK